MSDGLKLSKMAMPMESRLSEQIATATTRQAANCKRAELAAYLARLGRFDEARTLIESLRQHNRPKPSPELSIRLHFAQGLLSYFDSGGAASDDGVQRAHALSVATRLKPLQALCAAWLAQWAYTHDDVELLRQRVIESLQLADPDDHPTRARANLVVAQVLHLAGRLDLAGPWYTRAREHATQASDAATIGALMHNMAWQRMLVLRQSVLTQACEAGAGRHALMNAESTENFDQRVGDGGWAVLKPILRAQIVSLRGDAAQALSLYEQHIADEGIAARWQANLLADKGWCHAVCGQPDAARACAAQAVASLDGDAHGDDRAAAHSRLAQLFARVGDRPEAERHAALARTLWTSWSAAMATAVEGLSAIDENGRPV